MFIAALGCSNSCVGASVTERGSPPFDLCVEVPYKSPFIFGHYTELYTWK